MSLVPTFVLKCRSRYSHTINYKLYYKYPFTLKKQFQYGKLNMFSKICRKKKSNWVRLSVRKKNIARQLYTCFKASFWSTIFVLQGIGLIKQTMYREKILDKKKPTLIHLTVFPIGK